MAKRGLPAGFELQGAEGLGRALEVLPEKLNQAVRGAMASTGERMAEEVRRAVPVDTGALQRTVELNETLDGVEVSVGVGLSYSFRALADLRATATRAMMMLQDDLSYLRNTALVDIDEGVSGAEVHGTRESVQQERGATSAAVKLLQKGLRR